MLAQNYVNFSVVYAQNCSILYRAVHNPIAFSQLCKVLVATQKLWLPVWDVVSFLYVHMRA